MEYTRIYYDILEYIMGPYYNTITIILLYYYTSSSMECRNGLHYNFLP